MQQPLCANRTLVPIASSVMSTESCMRSCVYAAFVRVEAVAYGLWPHGDADGQCAHGTAQAVRYLEVENDSGWDVTCIHGCITGTYGACIILNATTIYM